MAYVARFTTNPEYDVQRRWTAFEQPTAKTPEDLAEAIIDLRMVRLPPHLRRQVDEEDEWDRAIEWVLDHVDIRYHEVAGLWMLVHNPNGLSCWRLEAETPEEAIREARELLTQGRIARCGFGDVTCGDVKHVAAITPELHVFWCEEVWRENDF